MRVLIANGDQRFLGVAQQYLSDHGHEVNIATNGLESVAMLRRCSPDVVVLDRELLWGGSDGVRACMLQVPRWSDIPVVLTSDDVVPEEFGNTACPPLAGHLQKPFQLEDLLVHLHGCCLNGTQSPL